MVNMIKNKKEFWKVLKFEMLNVVQTVKSSEEWYEEFGLKGEDLELLCGTSYVIFRESDSEYYIHTLNDFKINEFLIII